MDLININPDMIETGKEHWWSSFGKIEREISAKLFVRACQKAGKWEVTGEQLNAEDPSGSYQFNELTEAWIIEEGDKYIPTHEFVYKVFSMFPSKNVDTGLPRIKELI